VGAIWRFWLVRGYFEEGRGWFSGPLAAAPGEQSKEVRANALIGAGVLARHQCDYPAARARYEESLAISQQLGNRRGIAASVNNLANVASEQGDFATAQKLYEESLAIKRELGDRWGISASLNNLGNLSYRDHSEDPLVIWRART
jgi:tetratricopeptide (TPR) repeat protein